MRRPTLVGLAALLLGLVLAGSASASAAQLGSWTSGSGASNSASASALLPIASPGAAPQIPRPPMPSFLKSLFKAKPPPVPRWRPPVQRPKAPPPRSVPRARLSFDVLTLKYAPTTAAARRALRRIYNRDQYEKVSVHAFCWGVDQLADYANNPTTYFAEHTWRSIFFDFLRTYVEDYSLPQALQVVNGWTSVWNLAQIHPAFAYFHFRACYG
jgi:hypothetical protein